MKKLIYAFIFLSFKVLADFSSLPTDHKELIKKFDLGPLKNHAYCYMQDGVVEGHRVNEMQRIASVTKLFTSLLTSETMDLNRTFKTKIHIGKDHLHIEGGRDPYFQEEKILLLIQELNRLGHTTFKTVTYDSNFIFSDLSFGHHVDITSELIRQRLVFYTNPKNRKKIIKIWQKTLKFASAEGVDVDKTFPSISVSSIALSNSNPLQENADVWIHESRPLHSILKSMNVLSKNLIAQNLFLDGSKVKALSTLMTEHGISPQSYLIQNGSGLPIKVKKSRTDNLSTCSSVLKVITLLEESLKSHQLVLSDVVAVNGGKDLGSFRTRFKDQPETHEAVISKTGTVNSTSTLAGILLTDQHIPFAILNQTDDVVSARKFQDRFVARMFHHLGGPVAIPYEKIHIFPWDGAEFLVRAEP